MKKMLFLLTFMLIPLQCTTTNFQPELTALVDLGIETFVPSAIKLQIESNNDKGRAVQAWEGISLSIDQQLIPLLKGEKLQVNNLTEWLTYINGPTLPLSNEEITILKTTINIILRHIPTESLSQLLDKNTITATAKEILLSAFQSLSLAINQALETYPKPTVDKVLPSAMKLPPPVRTKTLTLSISFRGKQ